MKTSTWHKEWVIGFFHSIPKAEKAVQEGIKKGISTKDFSIFSPPHLKKDRIAGIKKEVNHPEWKKILLGAGIGFLVASVGVQLLLVTGSLSHSFAMDLASAFIRGFGGAVIGGFFGLVSGGFDRTLNRFYDDEGGSKIMVAIRCEPDDLESIALAEKVIKKAGSSPVEMPPLSRTMQRKLAHRH